ncbi:hypothetical protein BG011_009250 [Mortierella polycephala]|uniref:Protein kinase domain-containing protein n=1 Tax=Mortierella polycephala TaxID=41804 RepID=A0A9P6PPK7_9FUNG|nr:hypothetical protein BG011_009250 [Mortierella polycephala]
MYSHQPQQQQSNLSRSLPPTPSQLHPPAPYNETVSDEYFGDADEVPLPFPITTIVADQKTGLSLTLISALGAGSYAVVYLAKEVASGTLYALKCLGKDKLTGEEVAVQRNEVVIHTSLPKHRNIIHLFNMFETEQHLFLLLEYSSGMDMYQWISMRSDKSDPVSGEPYTLITRYNVIKSIFDQVLEGIGQVHQCGVAHRDIKPENFLIEYADGQYTVKITDFGLATRDVESDEFECGSKPYMSFECRNGLDKVYNAQLSDLWSLGIILINLLYHRCPWSEPCPRASYAFSEFLKRRVDFLQWRFEDMPGPVARWLGLRAFAFVGATRMKSRRSRPNIDEWKSWMADFVPRMLGQTESSMDQDDDDNEMEQYREYLALCEDDTLGQEVEGDEIVDDDDNQVVPISIQSSSLVDRQQSHLDPGRAYASYHVPTNASSFNAFTSSSVPKFDSSAFYQPTRLRQESWSDAIDMEGTEDAEMDFSAPILFEESEDDEANHQLGSDEDDSVGLAVAFPDDFIDPLPALSATSSGHQTPPTPTPTHLTFNSEKRQLPLHLRLDSGLQNQNAILESQKRNTGRASPATEANDQINTLVFIEPDMSRTAGEAQVVPGDSHVIASSLPSSSHMDSSNGPDSDRDKERVIMKQQMRRAARNLQDVKAAPFVFPPLKTNTSLAEGHQGSAPAPALKERSNYLQHRPSKSEGQDHLSNEASKTAPRKSGIYIIPKRSQLGPWASSSSELGLSRLSDATTANINRGTNRTKGHHRGGSWTSNDDIWDIRKDSSPRYTNDNARTGSGRWRARVEDRDDGYVGLPPRVENKFRPRYRQGRRTQPQATLAGLPPVPPAPTGAFGVPRSRHQSRSGNAFDEIDSRKFATKDQQQQQHPQDQHPTQPKYEHRQLWQHAKSNSGNIMSKLAGQRNKSLVDLRTLNAVNQPWRQSPAANSSAQTTPIPTMSKARAAASGVTDFGQRNGLPGARHEEQDSIAPASGIRDNPPEQKSLADTEMTKDNVYHPPHWHGRKTSGSNTADSMRRPSSGYESDFTGWHRYDGTGPQSSLAKNRTASKGRAGGFVAGSTVMSSSVEQKQRPEDLSNNWQGSAESTRVQDPNLTASKKLSLEPPGNTPLTSRAVNECQVSGPVMTLTPPTPNVIVKSEFLAEMPTVSGSTAPTLTEPLRPTKQEQEQEQEEQDPKKVVKPGAMTGLGNMLRGLVAYNKNIKVGGEGINGPESDPRLSSD